MRKKDIKRFNGQSAQVFECEGYEGENIAEKMDRIINTDEPVPDDPNIKRIYTKRKDGVIPELDIRTDKWDIALSAADAKNRNKIARAEEYTKQTETTEETKEYYKHDTRTRNSNRNCNKRSNSRRSRGSNKSRLRTT